MDSSRYPKEEVDALEVLARPELSSLQIYSAVFFLAINTLRDVASGLWGRRVT